VRDVQRVLERLVPMEFEAETNEGRWYLLGIRPYRRLDKIVEGAVITFVEITERKRREV
jgi:two-component system CheB/CheR fusion protein